LNIRSGITPALVAHGWKEEQIAFLRSFLLGTLLLLGVLSLLYLLSFARLMLTVLKLETLVLGFHAHVVIGKCAAQIHWVSLFLLVLGPVP
jgi:hypothetical protein